ncbi:helix-turn-helix domain-containing protein [Agromyces larvae]|uniref:Helix-turn-helix domain-containing protein n=1 Tax=Agromyces larvae TaxID=2929802 RepID=A0ABY4C0F0_9MICO|nr:helix-turn-helix domain-containing protein [Agromyces larvae]UOE44952.1 helix-turn-helix domain-containing protein [Agromyces larvae]
MTTDTAADLPTSLTITHAPAPIAYSVKDAAKAVGVSESLLRREIRAGYLYPRYIATKQVITHADLERWARTLPTAPRA